MKPSSLSKVIVATGAIACFSSTSTAFAQKKGHEIRPMVFPVSYVECMEDESSPTCDVVFGIPEHGFIPKKTVVEFKPIHGSTIANPPKMTSLLNGEWYGEAIASVPAEHGKIITQEFLAYVDVELISLNYQGVFSELTDQAISFMNIEETFFEDPSQVAFVDCPTWERDQFQMMAKDIRFVGSQMRGKMEEPVVKGNLFNGEKLFDAMEACRSEHVRQFLSYVAMRPDIYMGKPYKISEVFATWLVEGAPNPSATAIEQMRTAKRAKDEAKFNAIASGLKPHEIREVVRYLVYTGQNRMNAGDKDESLVAFVMAEQLAAIAATKETLPRTLDLQPLTLLQAGNWELKFGDPAIALENFKEVKKTSARLGRSMLQLAAFAGEAQSLNKLGQHKKVHKVADGGTSVFYRIGDDSGEEAYSFTSLQHGILHFERAKAYVAAGVLEAAQGACWDALEFLEVVNSATGFLMQSEVFSLLAKLETEEYSDGNQRAEYEKNAEELAVKAKEAAAAEY